MIFKKLIFLLAFCCTFSFAFSNEYGVDFKNALEKAKATNKPMMILFVTTTCPWCKKLENQTLSKEYINSFIQKNFIPLVLDKEKDTFPKYLDPQVVPTIHFVNPKDEQSFDQIVGYKPHKEFFELIQKAHKMHQE